MRRIFFCIALLFLFLILFQTEVLGAVVKLTLKAKYNCGLAYKNLKWEGKDLVFKEVVLFDDSFHTRIDQVTVHLDWSSFPKKMKGSVLFEAPHLLITKTKDLPKTNSGWLDFAFFVENGILEWGGSVGFSFKHAKGITETVLEWPDGSLNIYLQDQRLEADLKNFHISLLSPWTQYGEISEGLLTGRVAVDLSGNPISANLQIENGGIELPLGSIRGVDGSFSYNNDLGAKWEFQGLGKTQEKLFPFSLNGRGFFQSGWVESNLVFDEAWCKISGQENWDLECFKISALEASWIQAGLVYFWPKLSEWTVLDGEISAKASYSPDFWNSDFKIAGLALQKRGTYFHCDLAEGDLSQEGANFSLNSSEYNVQFNGKWTDWQAKALVGPVVLELAGSLEEDRIPIQVISGVYQDFNFNGEGWVDSEFDAFASLNGSWSILDHEIPFSCPILSKNGNEWGFDFRILRESWDLLRLKGSYKNGQITKHPSSHFLSERIEFDTLTLEHADLRFTLPWDTVLSMGPFLKEWGADLKKLPKLHSTDVHLSFTKEKIGVEAKSLAPLFAMSAEFEKGEWDVSLESDLIMNAKLKTDGRVKGFAKWIKGFESAFEGRVTPQFHCDLALSELKADLKNIDFLQMEGTASGKGHFSYQGQIESDLDFTVSNLNIRGYELENEGQIHLGYSTENGAHLRGLNLHGGFDCVVSLLQYDLGRSHWVLDGAQIHLPATLLTHPFFKLLDRDRDLNFTANFDFASDFSTFSCAMREGLIPYDHADHLIENLILDYNKGKCNASFTYLDHFFRTQLQIDEGIGGRVIFGEEENPLTVEWEYKDDFFIHSIQGAFNGIDASFHAESPNTLMGSAHLNFTKVKTLLPADVAQVFDEIKMGNGYELKGQLKITEKRPFFQGILSGKAIELFGFQFRTLLAQVDLAPQVIRIFDVKISDSAGIMKVDEILLEGKNNDPWTIAIPHLSIHEMRPSLMLRPGETLGPMTPLVVRELNIRDFKGLLDDGNTYTATGELNFINSYKRQDTVFDIPANVLNRIVGLDFELLIPVKGDLTFDIKDGYFNLIELSNAYSEAARSEFFLEMDPAPRMSLDGNLEIYIKMKQFVLLKITESFLISIDGALDDPKFHLKKKRFFGLI